MKELGSYIFTRTELEWFAGASGDFNPIHVDPVSARRLITGMQTVHGMYTMLFALDLYYKEHAHIPKQIKVFFQKPVLEGEEVKFFFKKDCTETRIILRNNYGQVASILLIGYGITVSKLIPNKRPYKKSIKNNSFYRIKGQFGTLSVMAAQEDLERSFSNVSRMLGAHSVATIMSFSRLVGMSMPGLHSIFTGLNMKFGLQYTMPLSWKITRHISTNVPIQITLEGQGIFAEIDAFVRPAPVKQATMQEVYRVIDANAFIGQRALVIGGSRGLGELVAKCVVAGGGNVCITYANGKNDALKIKKEMNDSGGICKTSMLNVTCLDGVEGLLSAFKPTHIYYFATSRIRNNNQNYNTDLYEEYLSIYVAAFSELVRIASRCISHPFYVFYPSTVFIENMPKGFSEYANAKKEGEYQCKFLEAENLNLNIYVKRLPIIRTDQTSFLTQVEAKSALEEMRNVLIEMKGLVR